MHVFWIIGFYQKVKNSPNCDNSSALHNLLIISDWKTALFAPYFYGKWLNHANVVFSNSLCSSELVGTVR